LHQTSSLWLLFLVLVLVLVPVLLLLLTEHRSRRIRRRAGERVLFVQAPSTSVCPDGGRASFPVRRRCLFRKLLSPFLARVPLTAGGRAVEADVGKKRSS
jgi:hypothetical protein